MTSVQTRKGRPMLVVVVAAVAVAVGVLAGAVLSAGSFFGIEFPDLPGSKKIDRTHDVVLLEMKDLAQYHAASASFQVLVDIEKDWKFVPTIIAGEQGIFLGQGSVDGYVDFSSLGTGAIKESADGRSVTVTLPPAQFTEPRIDPKESGVLFRDRGVLDRVGGAFLDNPSSEKELYERADKELAAAAKKSDLVELTETNTRKLLEGMLRGFGYDKVTVKFKPNPQQ